MRSRSGQWAAALGDAHTVVTVVTSWLGPTRLATVPIIAGQIVYDVTARGRRRCQITVPLRDGGTWWDPGRDPRHPLATYGQQLRIETGVRHRDGTLELHDQGRYLITGAAVDEGAGTVVVTGADLYRRMEEAPIISNPWGSFGTAYQYGEVVYRLGYVGLQNDLFDDPQILLVTLNANLADRNLGGAVDVSEGSDRTPILETLCASWPAQMAVTDDGALRFSRPVTAPAATPSATITAGLPTSTLMGRGVQTERGRFYNAVYVRGINPATGAVRAQGSAEKVSGPLSITGPCGWISRWYDSPLITTDAQADATARAMLARGTLYAHTETLTAVPDPSLELNDTIDVITGRGTFRGLISSITLPLTAGGGPMTLTVTNDATDP